MGGHLGMLKLTTMSANSFNSYLPRLDDGILQRGQHDDLKGSLRLREWGRSLQRGVHVLPPSVHVWPPARGHEDEGGVQCAPLQVAFTQDHSLLDVFCLQKGFEAIEQLPRSNHNWPNGEPFVERCQQVFPKGVIFV